MAGHVGEGTDNHAVTCETHLCTGQTCAGFVGDDAGHALGISGIGDAKRLRGQQRAVGTA